MSEKTRLSDLVRKNVPLVDFTLSPAPGASAKEICDIFNEDPEMTAQELYRGEIVIVTASKEAYERAFGGILFREPHDCHAEEKHYYWGERQKPQYFPPNLAGKIASIGLDQPGRLDNGQPYDG